MLVKRLVVYDVPLKPYQFEAFYDVTQEEHARMLAQLAHQEYFYLAFCGEDGNYRFTRLVPHGAPQFYSKHQSVTSDGQSSR